MSLLMTSGSKPITWWLEGQSNAEGKAVTDTMESDLFYDNNNIKIHNLLTNRVENMYVDPDTFIGNNRGVPAGAFYNVHGIELRLAKLIFSYRNKAQLIHKYTLGDTFLADIGAQNWFPTKPDNLFLNSQASWASLNLNLRPSFIIWIQGENDSTDAGATADYATNLINLINARRAFLGYSVPYIIVSLSSGQTGFPNYANINSKQIDVVSSLENVVRFVQNEATFDTFHYGNPQFENISQGLFNIVKDYPCL